MFVVQFFFFIALAWSLTNAYDFFPSQTQRCQEIPANFTLCYGLGYTQMHLPNLLSHESITEILYELPLWQSLLSLGCHANARLLLCSILAPVCIEQTTEKPKPLVSFDNNQISMGHDNKRFLYPCRTLCESVKQSCEPRMISQFGYKWPSMSKKLSIVIDFLIFSPHLVACDQYPADTGLCVSHSSSSTTTTSATTTTTKAPSTNECSMCQSRATVNDLLNDYCRASFVLRTRPVKNSPTSDENLIFAHKHKVRYFKRSNDHDRKIDLPLRNCPCIQFHSPVILFLSANGELLRFISIKRNPKVFKRFRKTIVLRKPRCQRRS